MIQIIKTYKEYKQWAIEKSIIKGKEFSFEMIDDRLHYIYRVTNLETGLHYYGSRSSKSLDIGIKYFTSSKYIKEDFKESPQNYKIKIIKIFDNTKDKEIYESYLHQYFDACRNPKFINKANQTPFGHDTTGMVSCIDKDGNNIQVTKEEYDRRDDLVSIQVGKLCAKDINTGKYIQVTKEEYDRRDDLVHIQVGKLCAKDINTGKYIQVTKEEYDRRDDLVHNTKGTVKVKDLTTGKIYRVPKEEYENDDNLVGGNFGTQFSDETKRRMSESSKGIVTAMNKNTREKEYISKEEYDRRDDLVGSGKFTKRKESTRKAIGLANTGSLNSMAKIINIYDNEDNLVISGCLSSFEENFPKHKFRDSAKRNGERLFTNLSKRTKKRLENNGNIKYVGWYATYSNVENKYL